MPGETTPEVECPSCGGTELRPGSVIVATLPPGSVRPGKVRKVVEQQYRCLECGHQFSTVEESVAE